MNKITTALAALVLIVTASCSNKTEETPNGFKYVVAKSGDGTLYPSFCSALHCVQISAIKKIPQKAGSRSFPFIIDTVYNNFSNGMKDHFEFYGSTRPLPGLLK